MTLAARLQDLQFRLEYILVRLVIGAVRSLPLDVATGASAKVWRWLAPRLNPKRHKRALANLRQAFPEKSEEERRGICMAHWENLGRVMVETMRIDHVIAEPERIEIVSDRVFSRYKDKLGPVVGASLHMGNWEFAVWPLTACGGNPGAIYRSVTNPYVDRLLRYQRRDLYPAGLFGRGKVGAHGDDKKTARLLMDFVRFGGRLGMVCDLYDRAGIPVPFFGKEARTQAIGAMIARRSGARVWMSRCKRVGKESRFEIELKELRIPRTSDQGADIRYAMVEMQKQYEAWIREAPEQWMWSNRRWG